MDLVQTGEPVDVEKDFCLERFMSFAKKVTDKLTAKGLWADYIDPCSGLSMVRGRGLTGGVEPGTQKKRKPSTYSVPHAYVARKTLEVS